MQTLLLAFVLLFQTAPQDTTTLETSIESATVFLSGAEVQRSSSLTLQPGTNYIQFTGLSTSLNEETIQLGANKAIVLESISKTINKNKTESQSDKIRRLVERINILEDSVKQTQASLTVLDRKLSVLLANQDLSGDNTKLSATELEQAVNYFDDAFSTIETRRIELNRKLQELNADLSKLKNNLNTLRNKQRRMAGVIEMAINSESHQQATLQLSYFVPGARWYPTYDIRVEDVDEPLNLSYKATISQNTGVDWKNVSLAVSSAEPRRNANIPSINPVYVEFYEPQRVINQSAQYDQQQKTREELNEVVVTPQNGIVPRPVQTELQQGQTAFTFQIENPYYCLRRFR